jgi:hypothetical protein
VGLGLKVWRGAGAEVLEVFGVEFGELIPRQVKPFEVRDRAQSYKKLTRRDKHTF